MKSPLLSLLCSTFTGVVFFSSPLFAENPRVTITEKPGYYDEMQIRLEILEECPDMGRYFSESVEQFLGEKNWSVIKADNQAVKTAGLGIKLQIMTAFSRGNAWEGHDKSVSVLAELYKNGKRVDKLRTTRDSGGGLFGGFKGSCAVLYRCVHTLGSDVANWAETKI